MRSRVIVLGVALVLIASAGSAAAQAAAEAILTHSIATGAGASLGKSLGTAMGNATGQVAGRLGQQTAAPVSHPRVTTIKPSTPANAKATANSATNIAGTGSLIASIQGAPRPSTNCATAPKPNAASPSAGENSTVAQPTPSCAIRQDADTHPSVVNLPAPK